MANDYAPRMSTREYFRYLDRGTETTTGADAQHLCTELMHRWRGDPKADDLTETLCAHQEQLAAREHALRLEAGRRSGRVFR